MDISIYKFTKQRLLLKNTKGGKFIPSDKKLLLLFVKLERALRDNSFDAVQNAVYSIENYLITLNKRHLVIIAYSWVFFTDRTPNVTERDEILNNGDIRKSYVYKRLVNNEEIAISAWARIKYFQNSKYFLKIMHRDN
jgi:hypothetical protein